MNGYTHGKNSRPWIIVPVETKARELDGKLLLSCVAAEAGFGVVLGSKTHIEQNIRFLPKGLVIGNNIVASKVPLFTKYQRWGQRVAAWCEEGVAYRNRETYRHERVSADAIGLCDAFFAWGPRHAEDVLAAIRPEDRAKIHPTGSPRFDMLREPFRAFYAAEAARLREKYGPMFLVNTNFHRFNHYLGRGAYLESLRKAGTLDTEEREAFAREWIAYLGRMYAEFCKMIKGVAAAFPTHTIVVRPHPSEDHAAWRRDLEDHPNVKVIYEGAAIPWMMAAEAMIHNSCATGCEAFVLGVPVAAYCPIRSDEYDSYLPNAVSHQIASLDELLLWLRAYRSADCAEANAVGFGAYSGLQGPLASENIVAVIKELHIAARPFSPSGLHHAGYALGRRLWPLLRPIFRRLLKGPNPFDPYIRQKFPGLELDEVHDSIRRLRDVSGRFTSVVADSIGTDMFAITDLQERP